MPSRRPTSLLVVLLSALLGTVLLAVPAQAADKVVTITAEGVTPKVLEVAAGDTVTFVNEDTSFGYRAQATSDNWELDSGPVGLLPGRRYTHPEPITEAGTYTYRVAEGVPYEGSVQLRSAVAPRPSKAGTTPKPAQNTAPKPASSPTGGSGTAQTPPVAGGFGTLGAPSTPAPGGIAPPPAIALPELPGETAGPLPEAAPAPEVEQAGPLAVPGRLGAPAGYRGYGLPAALAVVLAAGIASLLVRLLLAEPTARRRRRPGMSGALTGSGPAATVD